MAGHIINPEQQERVVTAFQEILIPTIFFTYEEEAVQLVLGWRAEQNKPNPLVIFGGLTGGLK